MIPIYPSDGNATNATSPYGYSYVPDGDVRTFLADTLAAVDAFYRAASWGQFTLSSTIAPPLQVAYTGAGCGDPTWLGSSSDTLESLSNAAALVAGYDVDDYDFYAFTMPLCAEVYFAGRASVAAVGLGVNLGAWSYYQTVFAHELGHNLGAIHGSTNSEGPRGAQAWQESTDGCALAPPRRRARAR